MIRIVRAVGFGVLLVCLVGVGAGAASVLMPGSASAPGSADSLGPDGAFGGRIMQTPGTDVSGRWDAVEPDNGPAVLHGSSEDPDNGLRWTLRVYRSLTGQTCAEAGRTAGGEFGRAGDHGQLVRLPLEPAGACADLAVAPLSVALNLYAARPGQPERSVAFGVLGPDVASMRLVMPDGTSSGVGIDDRAFVVARRGDTLRDAHLDVTMRDGQVIERELG
jgi:hypothetical protein